GVHVAPEGLDDMVTDGFSRAGVPRLLSLVSVNVKVTLSPLWTRMSLPAFGVGEVERLSEVLGRQVLNGTMAKSLSVDVNDCEVRVCGMNVLMQPVKPIEARFTLPSISSFVSMFATLFPLPSRHTQPPQGTAPAELVTALIASVKPAPPPGSADRSIGGHADAPGSATQAIS